MNNGSLLTRALLVPALLMSAAVHAQAENETNSRPNIIFIMADDMGWADPGFNGGNPELTPNINRLATQGMRLTQFYNRYEALLKWCIALALLLNP